MQLPKKGEIIPLEKVKEICLFFHRKELWARIEADPPTKPAVSDGCSMFPDIIAAVNIYYLCLLHDLEYWCGGSDIDRLVADAKLMIGVAREGIPEIAEMMFAGVRAGGTDKIKTPWRWGFGRE